MCLLNEIHIHMKYYTAIKKDEILSLVAIRMKPEVIILSETGQM